MSKYALDTPAGRVEEALSFLGMSGPLSMTEDALEALDVLEKVRRLLQEAREYVWLFSRGEGEATDLLTQIDEALNHDLTA